MIVMLVKCGRAAIPEKWRYAEPRPEDLSEDFGHAPNFGHTPVYVYLVAHHPFSCDVRTEYNSGTLCGFFFFLVKKCIGQKKPKIRPTTSTMGSMK